jgi:FAD/FMN-containing dehydrogenase/Fe-S oxidoreductase
MTLKMKNVHNLSLYQELRESIAGDVFDDLLRRHLLSTDGSIFQKLPAAVVYPRSTDDVLMTVRFAQQYGLAIHSRGAGSGLCGSAVGDGIVSDFSKYMNRLIHLNIDEKCFTCEPGFRLGELEKTLAGSGLFFPPDPSSGEYATFGGMYGTNASGAHSVKYGNVADYISDARIVFSDGTVTTLSHIADTPYEHLPANLKKLFQLYEVDADKIQRAYPATRFNTSGYNLRKLVRNRKLRLHRLFAGSEGTLGIVTQLTFRLLPKPAYNSLVVAYMDDIVASARAVQDILPSGPSGIEVMDKSLLRMARAQDARLRKAIPANVDNVLLIEFDAFEPSECAELADAARNLLQTQGYTKNVHTAVSDDEKTAFWAVRKAAVPILYKLKGEKKILALIEDAAVPTDRLVEYFEGVYLIMERHDVEFVTYGHIAKGLLHTRPLLNLKARHDVALLRTIADELYELVQGLNGSISGEHGDGRLRTPYIKRQYPNIYDLFIMTKALLDPHGMLNPEIITHHDPNQMKKNLRYGADYISHPLKARQLNWPPKHLNGAACREIEKCHGCSKCTTVTTATRMCPVYKVTRDEIAAPKAKANILRALISGQIHSAALYETAFQQILCQCVNCGSCSLECPSGVNIPKMVLEARSQYAARFGTPLRHRLLTGVETLARLTHQFSTWFTPVINLPFIRKTTERLTGVSAKRNLVAFAPVSLRDSLAATQHESTSNIQQTTINNQQSEGNQQIYILYFAGCYASYIQPAIGRAAINVLSNMNMVVHCPEQHCCGLPMLSKGMVPQARQKISANLKKWSALADQADYIVVTCSSCGHALMQDWHYLQDNAWIDTISQKTIHITRLINIYFDRLKLTPERFLPKLAYHAPCHLRIQPDSDCSFTLLSKLYGTDVENLKGNCCGMAGSWGMTARNYHLSKTISTDMIGKLNRSDAAIGVTDCPTCRMQMEQFSDKPIKHPIEIIEDQLHKR